MQSHIYCSTTGRWTLSQRCKLIEMGTDRCTHRLTNCVLMWGRSQMTYTFPFLQPFHQPYRIYTHIKNAPNAPDRRTCGGQTGSLELSPGCLHCQGQGQMLCEVADIWRVLDCLTDAQDDQWETCLVLLSWDLSLCVCVCVSSVWKHRCNVVCRCKCVHVCDCLNVHIWHQRWSRAICYLGIMSVNSINWSIRCCGLANIWIGHRDCRGAQCLTKLCSAGLCVVMWKCSTVNGKVSGVMLPNDG